MSEVKIKKEKATAWLESIAYIECPSCDNLEEYEGDDPWKCEKCKKVFEVDDQT